jgi:maltose alpha-D-glucosyltransferase/alpha-amylase
MSFEAREVEAVRQSESWIKNQRWYGDKGRSAQTLTPEVVVPIEVARIDAALVVARFAFDRGADSRYFVPLVATSGQAMTDGGLDLRDAMEDSDFLSWFIKGFEDERLIEGEASWRWRRLTDDFPSIHRLNFANSRIIAAEQSNTSVVFDNQCIGKIFRRLQPGINPDLEIGEFLSVGGRFAHAPQLYGVVEVDTGEETIAVAAIQQFVRNQGDGWSWTLAQLGSLSAETSASLVDAVALLGTRTGEMHVALSSDPENPAFSHEEFTRQDAEDLISRVIAEIQESVEGLATRLSPPDVEQLHKGLGQLMGGAWSLVGAAKTRVHGDYHLGQTLRTVDDDFCLIDFEGEPSRPMEQRRAKQSPLKDVAGMLRSLDYAVATVTGSTDDEAQREAISAWQKDASAAFIDAYRRAIGRASITLAPEDEQRFTSGLNLLIAEKALYEIRYELNNRPDWLPIPLNGVRRLAGIPIPQET